MSYERELNLAREAATRAGASSLDYQRRGVTPEMKADDSPVTIADKEAEKLIVGLIAEAFPQDGILGEEGASREGTSGRRWIVDPIDGTRDFIRGNPLWGVLIGMEDAGDVVAGVAYFPGLERMSWASRGDGAYTDGRRLQASARTNISESVLLANGLQFFHGRPIEHGFFEWMSKFFSVRSLGGSLDATWVAEGLAEVWIEPKVAPWDLAAHKIILEEAGAKFFNFDGGSSIHGGNAVGCAPGVEAAVRAFLVR
jgi:histidinol phosphatase-like enzyme (inositol monophosphatase family)